MRCRNCGHIIRHGGLSKNARYTYHTRFECGKPEFILAETPSLKKRGSEMVKFPTIRRAKVDWAEGTLEYYFKGDVDAERRSRARWARALAIRMNEVRRKQVGRTLAYDEELLKIGKELELQADMDD